MVGFYQDDCRKDVDGIDKAQVIHQKAFVSMGPFPCVWIQAKGKGIIDGIRTRKILTWVNWDGQPVESRCQEPLERVGWGIQEEPLRTKTECQDSCWICPSVPLSHWKVHRSTGRGSFPRRARTNPKPRSYMVFFHPGTGSGLLALSRHSPTSQLGERFSWHAGLSVNLKKWEVLEVVSIQCGVTCLLILLLFALSLPSPVHMKELRAYFWALCVLLLLIW